MIKDQMRVVSLIERMEGYLDGLDDIIGIHPTSVAEVCEELGIAPPEAHLSLKDFLLYLCSKLKAKYRVH